jgi:hypothetical protein
MTFTLAQHKAWCVKPNGQGPALIEDGANCVGIVRRSWGQPSWGGSAKIWWESVPKSEKHFSSVRDVPEGAACWAPLGNFHHCWVAAADLEGWSTDYAEFGTFDLSPMALPRWTGKRDTVWWTTWSKFGRLPVGKSYNELHKPVPHSGQPKPPASKGVPVKLGYLKYGVMDKDDVRDLQRALNKSHGTDLPETGNYLDQTDLAVRNCQKHHGFGLDPKRHSFVGRRQAIHLGLKPV